MYAGFVTTKHVIKRLGIHQRFDIAAYTMVESYFRPGSFPAVKQILHFEGINGPDGLKVKSPGQADPSHFYDPLHDKGELPVHIAGHYRGLVEALTERDMVRAAFESSWLAHYVVDGLTPAHHQLLEDEIARICGGQVPLKGIVKYVASGEGKFDSLKKNWAIWGGKGIFATHQNFEVGIAVALLGRPGKTRLDDAKLARARRIGLLPFFKEEARQTAKLGVYERFQEKGWTGEMAGIVKNQIAPQATQAVGIAWLLAYLEAGAQEVKQVRKAATVG